MALSPSSYTTATAAGPAALLSGFFVARRGRARAGQAVGGRVHCFFRFVLLSSTTRPIAANSSLCSFGQSVDAICRIRDRCTHSNLRTTSSASEADDHSLAGGGRQLPAYRDDAAASPAPAGPPGAERQTGQRLRLIKPRLELSRLASCLFLLPAHR